MKHVGLQPAFKPTFSRVLIDRDFDGEDAELFSVTTNVDGDPIDLTRDFEHEC